MGFIDYVFAFYDLTMPGKTAVKKFVISRSAVRVRLSAWLNQKAFEVFASKAFFILD